MHIVYIISQAFIKCILCVFRCIFSFNYQELNYPAHNRAKIRRLNFKKRFEFKQLGIMNKLSLHKKKADRFIFSFHKMKINNILWKI